MTMNVYYTDNQDGSGGTFHLSGSGGGANILIKKPGQDSLNPLSFGPFTDGNIVIPMTGFEDRYTYFAQVVANAGTSPVFGVYMSLQEEAIHWRAMAGLSAILAGIGLSSLRGIYREIEPNDINKKYPCIQMYAQGTESVEPMDQVGDRVILPCTVEMILQADVTDSRQNAMALMYRQKIRREVRRQWRVDPVDSRKRPIPGVVEVQRIRYLTGSINDNPETNIYRSRFVCGFEIFENVTN